ncbi:hypothetical protein HLB23_02160 [Nocardia uniformis]|uniref:Uncharacterized protein n=1 Tax=Nocardia uniformis TaxID=53432 RepID=A0A849BRG2_9NOCA|nr:hypothetical protein [Nocardia uniformis]NNH68694.1 hypothetical protein [Nocardia uniformis]
MEKRALGTPDLFVWLPVLGLLEGAFVCTTILQSTPVALGLIGVAVLLVLADSWLNR